MTDAVAEDGEAVDQASRLRDFALQHVATVIAAAVVLVAVLRVMVVSRGDTDTAQAVLRYVGPASILIGQIPAVVGYALFTTTVLVITYAARNFDRRGSLFVPCVLFLGLSFFVLPRVVLVVLGVLVVVTLVTARRRRRKGLPQPAINVLETLALTVPFLVLFSLLLDDSGWLPTEIVETDDGRVVGQVLRDNADPVVVLEMDGQRRIVFVAPATITSRSLCGETWWPFRPILFDGSGYPKCPDD